MLLLVCSSISGSREEGKLLAAEESVFTQLVGDGRHQTGDHGRRRGASVSPIALVLLVLRRDQGSIHIQGVRSPWPISTLILLVVSFLTRSSSTTRSNMGGILTKLHADICHFRSGCRQNPAIIRMNTNTEPILYIRTEELPPP